MEAKHGGNIKSLAGERGLKAGEILDFSANINPLGPPAWLRNVISRGVEDLLVYPDPDCEELRLACARVWNVSPERILPGNGESELIRILPLALAPQRILIPVPAYVDYAGSARVAGIEPVFLKCGADFSVDYRRLGRDLRAGDLVFLGHPANPAGKLLERDRVLELARRHNDCHFIVDEAFIDFVPDAPDFLTTLTGPEDTPTNLLVLRSFTKSFAIPGLRLGFLICAPEIIARVRPFLPDWSVNSLAQAAGIKAVEDLEYLEKTRRLVGEYRQNLFEELQRIPGLDVFPGVANYLLLRLSGTFAKKRSARQLEEELLGRFRIAIRVCHNYEALGPEYFRLAVRAPEENEKLLSALYETLTDESGANFTSRSTFPVRKRRARPLMIQGTASNAGKSLLTAAFCRILLEDGVRVAPFKAQNMSLNSFVTPRGGEIARAQAVQAAACRIDPDVRMSPVLLKPGSETGSQVIVAGKPAGHMRVREYQAYKKTAWEEVKSSYDSLASEYDAIVLEGAGSPGEVNLKQGDIVNMRMAQYARAPVLLAGDIDRGGVFAGFVGNMEVMEEWERKLVAGYIVNRFRGDASLLDPAFTYMREVTGRPVLGVIPYLRDHGVPEEDSVNFKDSSAFFAPRDAHSNGNGNGSRRTDAQGAQSGPALDIALIDLPYISNFTDFEPLAREPDVSLRIVREGDSLGRPDAVLLPGTKNSLHDLEYLNRSGLSREIEALAGLHSAEIVGICGGMQMLGRAIHDPGQIESSRGSRAGLKLLNLESTLAAEKTLRQVRAVHRPSGMELTGYEIHHGRTVAPAEQTIMTLEGEVGGVADDSGRVWGAYLHGIFDGDEFRRWFLDRLRTRRGLAPLREIQVRYDLEPVFTRLAAHVRENMDMDAVYRIMGL